ncbi:MAG: hypothetical protein JWM34_473 [Ilumatobacteraceae bacterium]|nr:hypothetical protein [Ilumatobacteraceae bacterium]
MPLILLVPAAICTGALLRNHLDQRRAVTYRDQQRFQLIQEQHRAQQAERRLHDIDRETTESMIEHMLHRQFEQER